MNAVQRFWVGMARLLLLALCCSFVVSVLEFAMKADVALSLWAWILVQVIRLVIVFRMGIGLAGYASIKASVRQRVRDQDNGRNHNNRKQP